MFLKKIEICGFKSFAGKYSLDFQPGIVGVVGPNGSGKSNIADAIRWVLGEQSYKLLRAKKSEDIIFAGSAKKSKASYVEVSLLLDNIDNKNLMAFEEIMLSRRLYRDGNNEYLINGQKVRLFDIQELILKSGFGRSGYSVIGQGMVDQLLFLSAEERKSFFNEAVGVKQFELKREQSLKKLAATEQNLQRVQDIVIELEPRLRVLKSQFKRSMAREELKKELIILQEKYYGSVWEGINEKISSKNIVFEELQNDLFKVKKELDLINSELDLRLQKQKSKVDVLKGLRIKLETMLNERENIRGEQVRILSRLEIKKDQATIDSLKYEKETKLLKRQIDEEEKKIIYFKAKAIKKKEKLTEIENKIEEVDEYERQKYQNIKKLRFDLELKQKELAGIKDEENKTQSKLDVKKAINVFDEAGFLRQITKAENLNKEISLEIKNLTTQLKEKDKEIAFFELDLQKKNNLIEETEKNIQILKQNLQFNQPIFAKEFNDLYDNFVIILNELEKAEDAAVISKLKKSLKEIETKLRNLLGKLRPEKSDTIKKIEMLKVEIEKIIKVKNTSYAKIDIARTKRTDIQLNIKEKVSEILSNKKEMEVLFKKNEEFKKNTIEITALTKESQKLKQKRLNKEKEIVSFKAAVDNAEANNLDQACQGLTLTGLTTAVDNAEANNLGRHVDFRKDLYEKANHMRQEIAEINLNLISSVKKIEECKDFVEENNTKIAQSILANEEIINLNHNLSKFKKELTEKEKEVEDLKNELIKAEEEDVNNDTTDLNQQIRKKQILINEIDAQTLGIKIDIAKLETKKEDLELEIKKELGILFVSDLNEERIKKVELPKDIIADLYLKIEKLRTKYISIGDIDPLVKEEYEEVLERFKFISSQLEDLGKAKIDLDKVIEELNKQIKSQFKISFAQIAQNFGRYFEILFNGGKAELKIDADGNIDISAKPPGKRMDSLNVLSGGERTLTALSLLSAILDLNPSPFIVMDEVDAALDEVNTEKFLKIIKELSQKTQFIFITHNRTTMKIADILYGVTMDENHVSSLLSIKLEGKDVLY